MHPRRSTSGSLVLPLLAVLSACTGRGGDIGPRLSRLPDASFRLLVRDDGGRPVVNADVVIAGFESQPAATDGSGRADFFLSPRGRRTFRIGTGSAIATIDSRLASLLFAGEADSAGLLVPVAYLADLAASAGFALDAGVLATGAVLDDSAATGALLTIPANTTIAFAGAARATLRTGMLRADHLPILNRADGAPVLATRGIQIEPPTATFAPGITLTIPNDIGLRANETAVLYELDPIDGEWRAIGSGAADATATTITTATPAITRATLYAFAVPAPTVATFSGRLAEPDGFGFLRAARVRAGQVAVLSDNDGRFTLPDVPIARVDATVLRPTLTISGGRTHLPVSVERELDPAAPDLGQFTVDIEGVVDLRTLVIARGQTRPFSAVSLGSIALPNGASAVCDDRAELTFPAVTDRFIAFLSTQIDPVQPGRVLNLDGRAFIPEGRRNFDLRLFFGSEAWTADRRGGTRLVAVDPHAGGRVAPVAIHRRLDDRDEFRDRTRTEFEFYEDTGRDGEIIGSMVTYSGTREVHSACSVRGIEVARIELPLVRAKRTPFAAFEPFWVVMGDFTGSFGTPHNTFSVRGTAIENADRWLDAALDGTSLAASAPVFLDPMRDGGTAFRLGLPVRGGHLAAVAGDDFAGHFEMRQLTFGTDLRYPAGTTQTLYTSGMGTLAFDTDFTATGAFAGLDATIPEASFRSDLALVLPDQRVIEIARAHDGNLVRSGEDAVLRLPPPGTTSEGASIWLAVVGGSSDLAGVVRRQRTVHRLGTDPAPRTPLLGVPTITAPAHGAQVSADSFEVNFTVPAESTYVMVTLHAETGDVTRDWKAILPPTVDSFLFRRLPEITDDEQVLAPGDYTLEVTAFRVSRGPALEQYHPAYQAIASRIVGIGAWERQLDALSSIRIEVEVRP